MNTSFSFLCWNINGLIAKLTDPDFVDYITSFDVCFLSETFTLPSFDFSTYFSDFIVLHSPGVKLTKMGHVSGGTVMLIRKCLSDFVETIDTKSENVLCVKLSKELFGCEKDMMFIGLYNHPVGSVYYDKKDYDCTLEMLEQFILSLMEAGRDVYYLLGGDLNARIGDWCLECVDEEDDDEDGNVFERKSQDVLTNNFGKILIQFCCMFHLVPLHGLVQPGFDDKFTFVSERGNSTIDHFLSSVDFVEYVNMFSVVNRIESHHMPVRLDVCAALKIDADVDSENKTSSEKLTWDSSKASVFLDFLSSREGQTAIDDAAACIDDNSDAALTMFVNTLLEAGRCMRRTVFFGGRQRRTSRWFDTECREGKREVNRLLSRYSRTRKVEDKLQYLQKRSEYQNMIKEKKKAHRKSVQDSLLENRKNPSMFWSTVKRSRPRERNRATINIDVWKDHFENILGQHTASTPEQNENVINEESEEDVHIYELDEQISLAEVKQAIRKLKAGKASGIDEIPAEFLKAAEDIVAPFLTKFFNRVYDTGVFPKQWSQSVIVPLLKKGDVNNPGNYRGISLLSTISKVFTSILNRRLYKWAESEHKICEEQAGFRKNYSTIDHLFTLVTMIKKCLYGQRRSKLYVAFIDYLKAFDSVDRDSLWVVLQKIKTSTKMLRMLQGIYDSVQSCVRWGPEVSDFFDCPAGVKQGCMLSPLIFSLLITEVADKVTSNGRHGVQFLPGLQEIFLLLFADDICLISTTPVGLQNQLNNLEQASSALGLSVNLKKTKVMVFRKGGHLSKTEKWFYQGKPMDVVNSYKYLGVTLTTKLSFDIALEEFAGRAKGKVVEIMKTMWSLGSMDVSVFFKLFDALVKPMLLYASEIWGITRFRSVESPHLFACKRFLNVLPRTPNAMAYGELGRFPLFIDSTVSVIRYWLKLQNMFLVRLPRQAYEMDKKRFSRLPGNEVDLQNWACSVKRCLDMCGFSFVWLNGGVVHEKAFLRAFRQRLIDCYKQEWFGKIMESDRFSTYSSFKSLLQPEKYLTDITLTKFRNIFVKLRLGIIDLNGNKRYSAVPNTCPFCPAVENEIHFLLHCPKYQDLRVKYILKYFTDNVHVPPLIFLLQNESIYINRAVAMYCYYAMKTRDEEISNRQLLL